MHRNSSNNLGRRRSLGLRMEVLEARQMMAGDIPTASFAANGGANGAEINAEEQLFIELVNRARANPSAELERLRERFGDQAVAGIKPLNTEALPPLSVDAALNTAAFQHSDELLVTEQLTHRGADGNTPQDRASEAGYTGWVGENIASRTQTGTLSDSVERLHLQLFQSEGHRINILGENYGHLGLGLETASRTYSCGQTNNIALVTQVFGDQRESALSFLTGVVYTDGVEDDDFYTVGEGVEGVTITAKSENGLPIATVKTNAAGGYALPLLSGSYMVDAMLPGGEVRSMGTVAIHDQNVKLDLATDRTSTGEGESVDREGQTPVTERQSEDLNGDGRVTHLDALIVINRIERGQYDVRMDQNGDGFLTPIDALRVINRIGEDFVATGPVPEREYESGEFEEEVLQIEDYPIDDHPTGP